MSEDSGGVGESGFELARAFVSVNPDAASFEESLEEQIGEINYVVQIPVVADAEDLPEQVQSAADASNASITVPVVADAEGLPEQVQAAADASHAEIVVPVVADTAGLAEQVGAAAGEHGAEASVPVTADAAGMAAETEAAAAEAGTAAGVSFADRFAAASEGAGTAAGAEIGAEATAEGGAAGEAAGVSFAEKFASVASSANLFPAAGETEAAAATAGDESGAAFASAFGSMAALDPGFGGMWEKLTAEAATSGRTAAEAFTTGFETGGGDRAMLGGAAATEEAAQAGEEAAAGFSSRFAAALNGMPLLSALVPDAVKDAAVAGAQSAEEFGSRFKSALGGMPLLSGAFAAGGAEQDAAVAGEDAAGSFGSRFKSKLGNVPLLGNIIPGVESEAAAAGAGAGESFMGKLKEAVSGNLMEIALGGGFIAAAADMATKFQAAMEMVHTQAGVGQSAIAGLSGSVLNLAGQVGESPDSLAQALYHIESSFQSVGITGSKAMSLLQVAAEGARTGGADLVDVTNALDATIASGIGGVQNYSQAMGALNAIVGAGDMTMQNLADAMGTGLMAVAKSYGQNINDIGAALATFGDNNIRGAKAATDLRMAMQAILAPLKTGDSALQSIGLTATQLGQTMEHQGLTAAIDQFVEHLKASKVPVDEWGTYVTEIFGKRAGSGIGVLVDQLARLQSKLPDVERGANNFGSAWASTEATTSQKLKDLESSFESLMIRIGNALLPSINAFIGMIDRGLPSVERFGASIAHLIAPEVTGFFDGLHSILSMLLGPLRDVTEAIAGGGGLLLAFSMLKTAMADNPWMLVVAGVAAAITVIGKLHGPVKEAVTAIGLLTGAFFALDAASDANPFAPIILAVGALAVLIIKYHKQIFDVITKTWDDVASFFSGMYDKIVQPVVRAFDAIKSTVTGGFDSWWASHGDELESVWQGVWGKLTTITTVGWGAIMDILRPGLSLAEDTFREAWDAIAVIFKAAWDVLAAIVKTAWDVITAAIKIAWDVIVGIFSIALDLITGNWKQAWTDAETMVEQVFNAVKDYFQQFWNNVSALFKQMLNAIGSFLEQTWNNIFSEIKTVWNTIKSWFTSWWNTLKSAFTSAVGSVRTSLESGWNGIKSDVTTVWNGIMSFLKGIWSGMESGFSGAVSAIGKTWATLQSVFNAPVKFLVDTVYDKGIAALWNDVAGKIPGIPKMPIVSYASGGKVTAGTGPKSDDVLARVSKGETVVSAAHSKILAPAFKAVGVPGYADGGVIGGIGSTIGGAISSVASGVGSAISDIADVGKIVAAMATGNTAALGNALNAIVSKDGTPASGDLATMMTGIPKQIISAALGAVASAVAKLAKSGGGSGGPLSSGVGGLPANWQAIYSYLTSHGFSKYEAAGIIGNIEAESGGNPGIWETGGGGGYGLIQWTPPPAGLVGSGLSGELAQIVSEGTGMFSSPTSAAEAAYQYLVGREKPADPGATAGTREASANAVAKAEGFAEGGVPSWFDSGGYLPPGKTVAYNGTGGPERVLPPGTDVMPANEVQAAMQQQGGGNVVNLIFNGPQYPTPEQQQAMFMKAGALIGVS